MFGVYFSRAFLAPALPSAEGIYKLYNVIYISFNDSTLFS